MQIGKVIQPRLKKWIPYFFITLMVISIITFQMTHQFFINGTDAFFHMSVTYDTYRQFKAWNFSYFLSAFGFHHSLRIVNAVYGPLGGYFSGLVLLITGSWVRWEISMEFIMFMIAGISMYQLCRYWRVTRVYSILIGCLYMFSFPIMSLWQNFQYDGWGAVFMPWVLYFGSIILNDETFKSWKLILLLVILAEIHVFSLLLGLLVLGLCFIMSMIINQNREALIGKTAKILLLTAILSFNVWGGILEVLDSNQNQVVPTYSVSNLFQDVWGSVFVNPKVPVSQNFFLLGLATSISLVITAVLYILVRKYLNVRYDFLMIVLGLGFMWLSTRLFPWLVLQRRFPILDTDLQFPKRFLPVSLSAFGVVLGIVLTTLQHHMHNRYFGAIVMTIILGMFVAHAWQNTQYQSQFINHQQNSVPEYSQLLRQDQNTWINGKPNFPMLKKSLRNQRPDSYFKLISKATPDYLPTIQKIKNDYQYHHLNAYYWYNREIVQNRLPYHVALSHHVVTATFNRKSTKHVQLPFVKYAHTQIRMNGKPLSNPQLTQIGALNVKPRIGRNVLKFKYVPTQAYRMMMRLSVIVWAFFIIQILCRIKSRFIRRF